MFSLIDLATGKTVDVNFEQLCKRAGEQLDESFYTEAFVAHTLTGRSGKLVVLEEQE